MKYKCIKKQPDWKSLKVGEFYEVELIGRLLKIDDFNYYVKQGFFVVAEPEWLPNPMTGECPVPDGHDVEIMLKNNVRHRDNDPEGWNWKAVGDKAIAQFIDWTAFNQQQAKPTPTKSDGSTASYYELPEGSTELQHLISHRNMNAQIGEVFRACYRYGLVEHSEMLRDAKKIKFYAQAEIERLEKLASQGGE